MKGTIKRRTAKEEVVIRLRERIISGDLAPNEKLNLKTLSDSLGVSMTPVREAFEQLAADGLIRTDAYRGARVAELTPEEYQEIYLLRAGLEALAHRLGAERIDAAGCAGLRECLEAMESAAGARDVPSFVINDRRFHQIIYTASGRTSLEQKLMSLRLAAERYTRAVFTLPSGGMDDTVSSHRKIMGACQRNDGEEAERLIIDDLRLTYRSFVDSFADNK